MSKLFHDLENKRRSSEILYRWQSNRDRRRIRCNDKLKYPLKLVSVSYKGTYEDCDGVSYGDPNQGFFRTYWD